jgi:hypothetical protein
MGMLPLLLSEFHPEDILNAFECGLFSAYSHKKLVFSKVKAVMEARGVNIDILCLYVQIWIDLKRYYWLVIGKSGKARCPKNVKSLPCIDRHKSSAWITYALFLEFVICFERRMGSKKWKIILF